MGCDIHLFVEKKIEVKDGFERKGYWLSIDKWTKNEYFFHYPNEPEWHVSVEDEMYSTRNYVLFAILASVRNYFDIQPISIPRGLPRDVTPEIKKLSDYEGADGHSHSWLLLDEILNFDWDKTFTDDGQTYSYCDFCRDFIEVFIPRLLKIDEPEKIRIVFWFDN